MLTLFLLTLIERFLFFYSLYTNDLVFSLGINSPFVPGFPTEELPPPEQDTDATDADNNNRNILFMLIFIIKP